MYIILYTIYRRSTMRPSLDKIYAEVDMPEKNVSKSTIKGKVYVYHIGKGYRNAKGQPASDRPLIGRYNDATGRLIPNDKYFEIYDLPPQAAAMGIDSIQNFGDFYIMEHVVKELKLAALLNRVFGSRSDEIILMAMYMALNGNVLSHCKEWCEETATGVRTVLTSQESSWLIQSINEREKMGFFREWISVREQEEYLAYDVTSVSSYGHKNESLEWGYNRDGESLPQVNIGMYYGEESMLPIYYRVYSGSIPDKTHLESMMQDQARIGMKKCKYVMDMGFFSRANLTCLSGCVYKFVVAMPTHQKTPSGYIDRYGQEVKSTRYGLAKSNINAKSFETGDYGFRAKVHLFYSPEKAAVEASNFKSKVDEWEAAIKKGGKISEAARKHFTFKEETDGKGKTLIYEGRDYDYIDHAISKLGYFMFLTTDFEKTSEGILDIYRTKDVIEKSFDNLKNEIDMKRLRTHSAAAADGKMFVAFLGLILRSYIFKKLKDSSDGRKPVPLDTLFLEMRKIKVVKTKNGLLLHNPLTKMQSDILGKFGLSKNDIKTSLENLLS
jgi:transposase